MVIVPDKFIFLATPRTGSRAITEALLEKYPEAISEYPRKHHEAPSDTQGLPVYSVVRNPVDQLLSWWAHVDVRGGSDRGPSQFATEYENVMFLPRWEKYRLNIHADITDNFLLYTANMHFVKNALGINDLDIIGKSKYPHHDESEELSDIVENYFTDDLLLWYKTYAEHMGSV